MIRLLCLPEMAAEQTSTEKEKEDEGRRKEGFRGQTSPINVSSMMPPPSLWATDVFVWCLGDSLRVCGS